MQKKSIFYFSIIGILFGVSQTGLNVFCQTPGFYKIGAYSYKNSTFNPTITDGTWVRNNVFFCGYRNGELYGVPRKMPWIGVFDQASGKLVSELAWESVGPFNKIISNETEGTVTVVNQCYGQLFLAQLDSTLQVKNSYYSDSFQDITYVGSIGKSGGFIGILHEGDENSELTDTRSIHRCKVLYFNKDLKKSFESSYIDSTRILTAVSDTYGNVIGVSRKLSDDPFTPYQMEVLSLNVNNNINRATIPWILPEKTLNNNHYRLRVLKVHNIINPDAKGAGIVANVVYTNTEYPYYNFEKPYTAYFYMSADGTIKDNSIVKLVDPGTFDYASTATFTYENKVLIYSYALETDNNSVTIPGLTAAVNNGHLSVFDINASKITYSSPLATSFPFLKSCYGSDLGMVDDYSITALFRDTGNYDYYSVVYYMLNFN